MAQRLKRNNMPVLFTELSVQPQGGFYTIAAPHMADDLAVKIYKITQQFPNHELYGLTSQPRRSAVSIPANIAEGSGRRTISSSRR